jgi:hypothetical protein
VVGHRRVQIMLLSLLVDANALKSDPLRVMRPRGTRLEHGIFCYCVFFHTVFDDFYLEVHVSGHFYGAAEGDLSIALTVMYIAYRNHPSLDIYRQEYFRSDG